MVFGIVYDKQPIKFLNKINKEINNRILDKIEETLTNDPVPHDTKSIVGKHGVFRIRIGDYRVWYRINYQESKIIVFKIDKRSKVYQ